MMIPAKSRSIKHRCLKCQMWICDGCLDTHSKAIGCSTISSSEAMKTLREKHTGDANMLLNIYEDDSKFVVSKIQEYTDKKKELLKKAEKCGEEAKKLQNMLLLDVAPFSLGIETSVGVMTPIIRRNATIPSKQTYSYTTKLDNQLDLTIGVYEEGTMTFCVQ